MDGQDKEAIRTIKQRVRRMLDERYEDNAELVDVYALLSEHFDVTDITHGQEPRRSAAERFKLAARGALRSSVLDIARRTGSLPPALLLPWNLVSDLSMPGHQDEYR